MQNNDQINLNHALWCGILCASVGYLSLTLFGTPHEMIHILGGIKILPPIWFFNLLSTLFYFLNGIASGAVIDATSCRVNTGREEVSAYRGGLFFLSSFFLSLVRYHVFFLSGRLFIATLLSVACLITSILCSAQWSHVHPKAASIIMVLNSLWQFYVLFVNISVFISR